MLENIDSVTVAFIGTYKTREKHPNISLSFLDW
jgi:hypothetical protein